MWVPLTIIAFATLPLQMASRRGIDLPSPSELRIEHLHLGELHDRGPHREDQLCGTGRATHSASTRCSRFSFVTGAWTLDDTLGLTRLSSEAARQALMVGYGNAFVLYAAVCFATLRCCCWYGSGAVDLESCGWRTRRAAWRTRYAPRAIPAGRPYRCRRHDMSIPDATRASAPLCSRTSAPSWGYPLARSLAGEGRDPRDPVRLRAASGPPRRPPWPRPRSGASRPWCGPTSHRCGRRTCSKRSGWSTAGDVNVVLGDIIESYRRIEAALDLLFDAGVVPVTFGGDGAVTPAAASRRAPPASGAGGAALRRAHRHLCRQLRRRHAGARTTRTTTPPHLHPGRRGRHRRRRRFAARRTARHRDRRHGVRAHPRQGLRARHGVRARPRMGHRSVAGPCA